MTPREWVVVTLFLACGVAWGIALAHMAAAGGR